MKKSFLAILESDGAGQEVKGGANLCSQIVMCVLFSALICIYTVYMVTVKQAKTRLGIREREVQ